MIISVVLVPENVVKFISSSFATKVLLLNILLQKTFLKHHKTDSNFHLDTKMKTVSEKQMSQNFTLVSRALYRSDEKRSRNPPNVLTCLFLNVDGIFMEKARIKIFPVSSV